MGKMKYGLSRRTLVLGIILLFTGAGVASSVNESLIKTNKSNGNEFISSYDQQEIVLLCQENVLVLSAKNDTGIFTVQYAFPPEYQYQVPILLKISNDSTAEILHYQIEEDVNEPNKVINFTVGAMNKNERVSIHFFYWNLVKNHEYKDLPDYVKIPEKDEVPNETKKWLSSTDVVQANNTFIKRKAKQLRRGLNNNLLKLAQRTVKFTKWHRRLLYLIEFNLQTLFYLLGLDFSIWFPQDAITTLFLSGDCPGKAHLGCALLRANNVPARVVICIPPDTSYWMEVHYAIEYYCPGYGWILTETDDGFTPVEPKLRMIMRICYPEDENNTGYCFLYPKMTCLEQWVWIDNKNSDPNYKVSVEGNRIRVYTKNEVTTDSVVAQDVFLLTKDVFHHYEHYLGMNLTDENLERFRNAISYQKEAIWELTLSDNLDDYIYFMDKAKDEYEEIDV